MNICMIVYNLVNNGIGKVVLTYSAELVRHGHLVSILAGGPTDDAKIQEAESAGISVARLPDKKQGTAAYFKALRGALVSRRYDIAHVHGNSGMILPEVIIARSSRVAAVVCHCHNTGCDHPALHRLFKPIVTCLCDARLACSKDAGEWLYGKADFMVLPNAFNLARFKFDPESRCTIRKSFGIGRGTVVLGNIARLNPAKNHAFLVKVFEEYHFLNPDSMLLIAGGGAGADTVKGLVESSVAKDSIVLLGDVADPSKLYSCMDCFVFPSLYEGLGIVLVEAQASGLDCFVSENIPLEAYVTNGYHVLKLSDGAEVWADEIAKAMRGPDHMSRAGEHDGRLGRFDIQTGYRILEDVYEAALAKGDHR